MWPVVWMLGSSGGVAQPKSVSRKRRPVGSLLQHFPQPADLHRTLRRRQTLSRQLRAQSHSQSCCRRQSTAAAAAATSRQLEKLAHTRLPSVGFRS